MYCTQCGTEIILNSKFCHNCGTSILIPISKPINGLLVQKDGVRGLKEITGWVYIISNESMPRLVKIGYSTKDPELRAKELNNAGLAFPYVVEYDILLENPYYVEQETHKRLMYKNKGKEWFDCTVEEAIVAIKGVVGSAYVRENFKRISNPKDILEDAAKAREILKDQYIDCTVEQLIECVQFDDIETVKLLIAAGVDINAKTALPNGSMTTAINEVMDLGHIEIVRLLLTHGAQIEKDALRMAIHQLPEIAELLITHGANVNADLDSTEQGAALTDAMWAGQTEVVKTLLTHGSNIEAKDESGNTPLMIALLLDNMEIVQLLLARGADINAIADRDTTALGRMISAKKFDKAEFLLAHGADINATDIGGMTFLQYAIIGNNIKTVEFLLSHGVNIHAKDSDGQTPLIDASSRSAEIVKLLLAHGAKTEIKDSGGYTALMWASLANNTEIMQLLLAHGAKPIYNLWD